ncbi:MAG: hypothetical protein J6L73_08135 [Muribaculaceae bacterium]|nr:hypothetical protein [Muribaculaceae bacterium]
MNFNSSIGDMCQFPGQRISAPRAALMSAVAAWIPVACAAPLLFGTTSADAPQWALEGAAQTALGSGVAIFIMMWMCRRLSGPCWSNRMAYLLGAFMALVFFGMELNLAGYCLHASSWESPGLAPYSDSAREYSQALLAASGDYGAMAGNQGFAMTAGLLLRLAGSTSLLLPMLLNALCMTATVALCGMVCVRLFTHRAPQQMMFAGALLCALVPSIPYYGTMFMKEAPCCLGTMLMTVAMADAFRGRTRLGSIIAGAAGGLILMFIKSPIGWLMLAGACLAVARLWLARRPGRRIPMAMPLFLALVCMAVVTGGRQFRQDSDTTFITPKREKVLSASMLGYGSLGNYRSIVDDYWLISPQERVKYLPVCLVAQYLPPFPWNFTRDTYIARSVVWAHLSLLWYAVGGLALGWFVLCAPRRKARGGLGLWGIWWAMCYGGVAFMSAGTVARYWLPFLGICIPLAVQCVVAVREGVVTRRAFKIYALVYSLALAGSLTGAYIFLKG